MSDYVTKDSGARQEFSTGSVRDSREGKGRYDLISPYALARLAGVYERGAKKYADRNWEKGQPQSRFLDSAMRHLQAYLMGHRDEDHLAQSAWNIFALIHQEEMIRRGLKPGTLDDLPHYETDPWTTRCDEVMACVPHSHEGEKPAWACYLFTDGYDKPDVFDHVEGQTSDAPPVPREAH